MRVEIIFQKIYESDEEVRIRIAQVMCKSLTYTAKSTLLYMLNDKDYLVRVNACDSLAVFIDDEVLFKLLDVANGDPDNMVRCYAILAVRDISKHLDIKCKLKALKQLEYILANENDCEIRIAANSGIYILGNKSKLMCILSELSNNDYTIRCFVINVLVDISNSQNKDIILTKLKELNKTEKTVAVNSTLEYAIKHIEEK
ncbi:MAG: HEAT repeat domain-containing protein [bacterium]|nr:HEAT repeat domain-containing protein [bacterium]